MYFVWERERSRARDTFTAFAKLLVCRSLRPKDVWPSDKKECGRRDLNPHAVRRQILSLVCLPFHHPRGF